MEKSLFGALVGAMGVGCALTWSIFDLVADVRAESTLPGVCPNIVDEDGEVVGSSIIWCTKHKGFKCFKGVVCGEFQTPASDPCKIGPDGTASGTCVHCSDGKTVTGDFCRHTEVKTDSCAVKDRILDTSTKHCGISSAAECMSDPNNPGKTTCRKDPFKQADLKDCGSVYECY
jgi:hypothetical protein